MNSLFYQRWWLDAVAPGEWEEAAVVKGGETLARLPYKLRSRRGFVELTMPPLTQSVGPWLRASQAKRAKRMGDEKRLVSELIDQLPHFDCFRLQLDPSFTNWLPFYWKGFSQTTLYTYCIDDLHDTDALWRAFRENIRTDIRKAERVLTVRDDLGIEALIAVIEMTFRLQGRSCPHDPGMIRRVDTVLAARDQRTMLFAVDAQGDVHAAAYFVHDDTTTHYLLGGADPGKRNSGAGSLLIWHGLRRAAPISRCFNFEGSMVEPIERFFRAFGAKQVPYFRISKLSRRMNAISAARNLWRSATLR